MEVKIILLYQIAKILFRLEHKSGSITRTGNTDEAKEGKS